MNLSVIIPSRSKTDYLQKTIDDVLAKAEGEIEIIVVLDGYWPVPFLKPDKRIIIIHNGMIQDNRGMRAAINTGMAMAKGKYVMKLDEHCMMDQGFDVKLAADCDDNWVVIPRRLRLDGDAWTIPPDHRPPVDYMSIAYPYKRLHDHTCGLYGEEWRQKYYDKVDVLIDDTMTWQGSCYFSTKKYWDELIAPMDDINYGPFNHEAQEIGNKVWLGGGRLVVNKKTWYGHMHKGSKGKGYGFSNRQYDKFTKDKEKARLYAIDFWLGNKWDCRVHDWEWLMDKFWPVPTWPDNWRERLILDKKLNDEPYEEPQGTGPVLQQDGV
jgi:glycosyltransferase involved in cell wall biosynthesis